MKPQPLTRKAFCLLTAGASLGYLFKTTVWAETFLRMDQDIPLALPEETVPPPDQSLPDPGKPVSLPRKLEVANLHPDR